jgi:hypothetical protein
MPLSIAPSMLATFGVQPQRIAHCSHHCQKDGVLPEVLTSSSRSFLCFSHNESYLLLQKKFVIASPSFPKMLDAISFQWSFFKFPHSQWMYLS